MDQKVCVDGWVDGFMNFSLVLKSCLQLMIVFPRHASDVSWMSCFIHLVRSLESATDCKRKSNSCQESAERQIPRESYYNDEPEAKPRSIQAALDTERATADTDKQYGSVR